MSLLWILIQLSVFQTTVAKSIRSNAVLDMSGEIASRNSFTAVAVENNGILADEPSFLDLQTQAQISFSGFGVSVVKFMTGSNSYKDYMMNVILSLERAATKVKGLTVEAEEEEEEDDEAKREMQLLLALTRGSKKDKDDANKEEDESPEQLPGTIAKKIPKLFPLVTLIFQAAVNRLFVTLELQALMVDLYREINKKVLQMQTKAKWLGRYLNVFGDLQEHIMKRVKEGVDALCDEIVPEESDPGLGLAFAAFLEVKVPINAVCKHTLVRVMKRLVNIFLKIFQPVIDKFAKSINFLAKLITHVPHKDQILDWSKPARKIMERLLNCPEIQIKKVENGTDVEWSCPGGQRPAHNMKHVHDGVTTMLPPYDKPLPGAKKANLWMAMHGGRNKTSWEKFQRKKLAELNAIANMKCPQDTCTLGIDHLFAFIIFSLSGDMLKPLIFRQLAKVALDLFGVMFNPIDFGEGTEVYCGFGNNTQKLTDRRPKGVDRLIKHTWCIADTKAECISAYKDKLSSGVRLPCEWDEKHKTCAESTSEFCAIEKKKCGNKLTTFCTYRSGSQVECENSRAYLIRAGRTVPCFWNADKNSCEPDNEATCSVEEVKCGRTGETVPGAEDFGIKPKGSIAVKKCEKAPNNYYTLGKLKAKAMYRDTGDHLQMLAAMCAQHKVLVADGHANAPCEYQLAGKHHECLPSGKEICLPGKKCGHHEHLVSATKGSPCEEFFQKHYADRDKKKYNEGHAEACKKRFYKDSTGFYFHCVYREKVGLFGRSKFGCWDLPRESIPCHYQE